MLLLPENQDQLVAILTYHVVPGIVMAAELETVEVATVNGEMIDVVVSEDGVTVDEADVVTADIVTGNGVIHVIDAVMLP